MDYMKMGDSKYGTKIQLMETYVNIDFGNSPFLKLDNGLQIPYSSIKGITTGRTIPNAFKLYGALLGGMGYLDQMVVINCTFLKMSLKLFI
ncbi:hypothetical protein A8L34_14010 [Bacillus sp. FJAT-27264]|uniref:hypothetical protein n=1 Tax=Paenibacillus sp. (strain DSM 101736 / FJAT-27264) TaxID=1850362 RepID=UPI00080807D7|nr:hypothetical protein [Bacillus sp. FJAT-27264]OBZ14985.1 hypothetical protein A8L34_13980 [Bacillus sp. FJAT-27264]OBZ14990.1 hypothetical protein A8L34_14010 [Bacillus sp. FJAT-27264]